MILPNILHTPTSNLYQITSHQNEMSIIDFILEFKSGGEGHHSVDDLDILSENLRHVARIIPQLMTFGNFSD